MGIIKAAVRSISGGLADQWLEVIEAGGMSDSTVFAPGVLTRRGENVKGTAGTVSNGSMIRVYPNQFMMLVDGGKVVDYTAEEGYYTVNNSSMPSLFNGEFGETLKESFNRIRFGGESPFEQKVYFINLQEIKGIKFGTRTPVNYFDNFYNAELFLRAHGTYSIKITDPLRFYAEVIPKNREYVNVEDINEQYLSEFLEAFQTAINQMSADGTRISFVTSRGRELGKYMANVLDEDWRKMRGMEIQSVGIASISYDEESQELINLRNRGAMLSDASIREGYVQGRIAEGIGEAGSNAGGTMAGFMGIGMGMQTGGGFMGAASAANMQQMQMENQRRMAGNGMGAGAMGTQAGNGMGAGAMGTQAGAGMANPAAGMAGMQSPGAGAAGTWTCSCGTINSGKFCSECGSPRPAVSGTWTCSCGTVNSGKFCSECGKPRP